MELQEFNAKIKDFASTTVKGKHDKYLLGIVYFPGTVKDYKAARCNIGTMAHVIIAYSAEELKAAFAGSGLIFRPTKSKRFCRCINYFDIVKL